MKKSPVDPEIPPISRIWELIRDAQSIPEVQEDLSRLKKEIEQVKQEVIGLEKKKQEAQSTPSRSAVYRKRLEKLRTEIRREQLLSAPISNPEEIEVLASFLSRNDFLGKVLEYTRGLWTEKKEKHVVSGAKVVTEKVCFHTDFVTALEKISKLPPETSQLIPSIAHDAKEALVLLLALSPKVLAFSTPSHFVFFRFALSRKAPGIEPSIIRALAQGLGGGKEREEPRVSETDDPKGEAGKNGCTKKEIEPETQLATTHPIHHLLSRMPIHEDVLLGVRAYIKQHIQRMSLARLEYYNAEVFFGTVYSIEDCDRWLCDNLVTRIGACQKSEKRPLSPDEIRKIKREKPPTHALLDALPQVFAGENVCTMSATLHQQLVLFAGASRTRRFSNPEIQKAALGALKPLDSSSSDLFPGGSPCKGKNAPGSDDKDPSTDQDESDSLSPLGLACLLLCDCRVLQGLSRKLEETPGEEKTAKESGKTHTVFFTPHDVELAEAAEYAFMQVVSKSGVETIGYDPEQKKGAQNLNPADLESSLGVWLETVSRFFRGPLLAHIRTETYGLLFSDVRETISRAEKNRKPQESEKPRQGSTFRFPFTFMSPPLPPSPEALRDWCSVLLNHSADVQHMIGAYAITLALARVLECASEPGMFLERYHKNEIDLPETELLGVLPLAFPDSGTRDALTRHIKKREKGV